MLNILNNLYIFSSERTTYLVFPVQTEFLLFPRSQFQWEHFWYDIFPTEIVFIKNYLVFLWKFYSRNCLNSVEQRTIAEKKI